MKTAAKKTSAENFSFSSSVAADVWTPKKDQFAYEWWYFDALSDDGRDAVVVNGEDKSDKLHPVLLALPVPSRHVRIRPVCSPIQKAR